MLLPQIELLLRDEIVSALRMLSPIRSDALEYVTQHVQTLSGKPNTSTDTVPLQFVYGPEHSMCKFTEVSDILTTILKVCTPEVHRIVFKLSVSKLYDITIE